MPRSVKKGFYIAASLRKKIEQAISKKDRKPIKTWCRSSMITPDMVGLVFAVHNGKDFVPVLIGEQMVGHKLGEFALTRLFKEHAGDRKAKGR